MFLDSRHHNKIVSLARTDLRSFFAFDIEHEVFDQARREALHLDPTLGKVASLRGVAAFTQEFVTWLEKRKSARQRPWITKEGIVLDSNSASFAYLTQLALWCQGFSPSRHSVVSPALGYKLWRFGQFVANKRLLEGSWKLVLVAKGKEDYLSGNVSWLIVYPKGRLLYIMYDKELIMKSTEDEHLAASRLRRVFLHELGHARTKLGAILQAKEKYFPLEPDEESWLYAATIIDLVCSMKAQVSRLLGKPAYKEWLGF